MISVKVTLFLCLRDGLALSSLGDTLSIYDGTSDQAPLIEKLSGNLESFSIMSTGSSLFIRFQSDTGTEFEGFLIAINYGNTLK